MPDADRLAALKVGHRARRAADCADEGLSWEVRERAVREAGREYDRGRRAEEERATASPRGEA